MKISTLCAWCGKAFEIERGQFNRAKKVGQGDLYCNRKHSGLGRRKHKTKAQKKEEKRIYDEAYRIENRAKLKAQKAEWFRQTYDPAAAAIERKKNMPRHVEYCRRPEYREKKKAYDQTHLAQKKYGDFWECAILAQQIRPLLKGAKYEKRIENGYYREASKRARSRRTFSPDIEKCSLGNSERSSNGSFAHQRGG